jgi:hypothetical protein
VADREADRYFGRAIEDLEYVVAKQASILALPSLAGIQLNTAVAGMAFGACHIGLLHRTSLFSKSIRYRAPSVQDRAVTLSPRPGSGGWSPFLPRQLQCWDR